MSRVPLHAFVVALLLAMFAASHDDAAAQSEVDIYTGSWIPFLPDYKAVSVISTIDGTLVQPNVFNDHQVDYGHQIGIRGLHRFLPTRTMVEFDLNVAGIDSLGSHRFIADPDTATTVAFPNLRGNHLVATPNGTSTKFALDSSVLHYSEFIGLRDRFDLNRYGLGWFDLGVGFSHQGFQQDYSLIADPINGGLSGQYIEDLDTNYIGGEIRSTLNKYIHNQMVMLDINVGIYDMEADYDGISYFRTVTGFAFDIAPETETLKKTAATARIALRVEGGLLGVLVRPGISFTYISDMAAIQHPQTKILGRRTSLTTTAAYILGLNLEIML